MNRFLPEAIDALCTIGLLFRSAILVVALVLVFRWIPRFRIHRGEPVFIAALLSVAMLSAFPPIRMQGVWRSQLTGEPVS